MVVLKLSAVEPAQRQGITSTKNVGIAFVQSSDHQCESVAIGTFKGSNVFRQMWSTLYIPEGTREQLQWFNH